MHSSGLACQTGVSMFEAGLVSVVVLVILVSSGPRSL